MTKRARCIDFLGVGFIIEWLVEFSVSLGDNKVL